MKSRDGWDKKVRGAKEGRRRTGGEGREEMYKRGSGGREWK